MPELMQLEGGLDDFGACSFGEPFVTSGEGLIALLVYRAPSGPRFCV